MARAPGADGVLAALAARLDVARLQALLVRRAADWALAAAPPAARSSRRPEAELAAVAALLPAGVEAVAAADLRAGVAAVGRGPLLIAGTTCPRLGPAHATAALDDLASGCDLTFGSTLEGDWYLAGLREPRPELLELAALRSGGIGAALEQARALDASVGLLRHERVLTRRRRRRRAARRPARRPRVCAPRSAPDVTRVAVGRPAPTGGPGFEPGPECSKGTRAAIRRPPRVRAPPRYYDASRARPHRGHPRRRRGDAYALVAAQGPAPDLRAADDPVAAAGRPRRRRRARRRRRQPEAATAAHLPDDVEVAIQEQPRGTGDAVAAAAGAIDPRRARPDHQRRHAADHRRGDRRAGRRPRGGRRRSDGREHGARGPGGLRPHRPRRGGRRRAGRRDEGGRRRDASRSSRSARSTPASTCSTAARCWTRSSGSRPTTPRASSTCPTCSRSCARTASSSRRFPLADPDLALGVNDRVDLAAVTALAQRADPRAPTSARA